MEQYNGRFVVIVGEKVVGDFASEAEAYASAVAKYEPGKFMIQLVSWEGQLHPDVSLPRRYLRSAAPVQGSYDRKQRGISSRIKCDIKVRLPVLDLVTPPTTLTDDVVAVWDTGASGSVVTQKVIDQLGIQPISMAEVQDANQKKLSPVYRVDFYLPMGVGIRGLNVTLAKLGT